MFYHVRIGSSDVARAQPLYDGALGALGLTGMAAHGMLVYRAGEGGTMFLVGPPREGAASHGNGGTVAFHAPSTAAVDAFHAAGLAAGGTDEGAPGPRASGLYAAYLRDHDGNKFCAVARPDAA